MSRVCEICGNTHVDKNVILIKNIPSNMIEEAIFAAMEKEMSKINSTSSYISNMFG